MDIQVHRAEYEDVEPMRELYRQEANCQIICDSLLRRGLADPYVILVEGRQAGYGGVRNKYDIGRLMEFYTLPHLRGSAQDLFRELLAVSQATEMEAQTNMPLMLTMLYDCATDITEASILFQDAFTTQLTCPGSVFRRSSPEDAASIFPHKDEPVGDWIVEAQGAAVATGGFLCHYNPPYGDVFMEVSEPARRQGFGSYLVQEVKRVCYEAGKKPAARCNPANMASRRTLQKAGFLPCGRMLVGRVAH
ncbi:MAG TPA: GNAT family N-acetyltransferase [Chthonomonadaceae bacterium]|nr:GNAT family N-acetyltransferase [Chthonomonadaceae bacterium]